MKMKKPLLQRAAFSRGFGMFGLLSDRERVSEIDRLTARTDLLNKVREIAPECPRGDIIQRGGFLNADLTARCNGSG
jgi:hypothetical protein